MQSAYQSLAEATETTAPPLADPEQLEYSFNRLFVGPQAVIAPPFASVYLDAEPLVMGETTLTIRRLYHLVGLASPWEGTLPDDHLALELDVALQLRAGLHQTESTPLQSVYHYFLHEHLARWIPLFLSRVAQADDLHPAVRWVCEELGRWLDREQNWFHPFSPQSNNLKRPGRSSRPWRNGPMNWWLRRLPVR